MNHFYYDPYGKCMIILLLISITLGQLKTYFEKYKMDTCVS